MDLAAAPDAEAKTDTSDCDDTHVTQGENNGYFKSSDDVSSKEGNVLACKPDTSK